MTDAPPSIKITLLGNPGVGKTCIISRYIDDVFDENNAPTIGANYSEKVIKYLGYSRTRKISFFRKTFLQRCICSLFSI